MTQKLYEESNIQAIADSIRGHTGGTTTYKVADMAGAVSALDVAPVIADETAATATDIAKDKQAYVNGELVTGTVYVVKNVMNAGVSRFSSSSGFLYIKYDFSVDPMLFPLNTTMNLNMKLDNFGDATAEDVAKGKTFTSTAGLKVTGTLDTMAVANELITGTATTITSNVKEIRDYGLYRLGSLTTANFPKVTEVGDYAFAYCSALTTVNMPVASYINIYAFSNCTSLLSINLPYATFIFQSAFAHCHYLEEIDLGMCSSIGTYAFNFCYSLKKLILRSKSGVASLGSSAFQNCYHILGTQNNTYNPDGLQDGYIYVPDNLVDSYKANSSWSKYATQIKGLSELPT